MNLTELKQHAQINFFESQKAVQDKNIVKVLSIAKPIIQFLSTFFIIPKKIRSILNDLLIIIETLIDENVTNQTNL